MTPDTDTTTDASANVLLGECGDHDCDETACMSLLGARTPADRNVLFVTFTRSAERRLGAFRQHAASKPARVGVVSVDTSGPTRGTGQVPDAGRTPIVSTVSDPSDLTGVGIAVSEYLAAWAGNGNQTVVCFDSLTALLQYVEPRRVYQFLNELTSKLEQADAIAHFHVTPGAHEDRVLRMLVSLFDERLDAQAVAAEATGTTPIDEPAAADSAGDPEVVPSDDVTVDPQPEAVPLATTGAAAADDPSQPSEKAGPVTATAAGGDEPSQAAATVGWLADRFGGSPRTTATVVGVVTLLVLFSLMAGAVPMPVDDTVGDAGSGDAAGIADGTATPTEQGSTTVTATATATPSEATATPTESESSVGSGSSGSSGTTDDSTDSDTDDGDDGDGDDGDGDDTDGDDDGNLIDDTTDTVTGLLDTDDDTSDKEDDEDDGLL